MKTSLQHILLILMINIVLTACSQTAESAIITIGVVNLSPSLDITVEGFKVGMADLGYIEGENVIYVYEGAAGHPDNLDSIVQNVMMQEPDLILSMTTPATLRIKSATADSQIPVVFAPVFNPVGSGIADSFNSSGNNLTGIRAGGHIPKVLEWYSAIVPDVRRLLTLHNPDDDASIQALTELQDAANKVDIEIVVVEARSNDEVASSINAIPNNIDAIFALNISLVAINMETIVDIASEQNIPVFAGGNQYDQGAVMSYGVNLFQMGDQASRIADQILRGATPEDIPIELTDFFLGINLQSAEAIGLTIPNEVLEQSDEIIR